MRLRSRVGVAGSFQMPGRSVTSWEIRFFWAVGELPGVLLAGFVVGGLRVVEGAQGGVPVGFEGAGDEPVGGVDREVAAAGQVGVVAGALDVGGAQRVGVGGSLPEFGGDLEGGLDGQRGEGVDEQRADVLVEGVAGDGGADRAGVVDAVALAEVGGQVFPAAGVVADGHPPAAAAADDDALQQGGAFAGRPGGAVAAVRGGVGRQPGDVGLPLVHGDVSGVGAGDEGDPFLAGHCDAAAPFPAGPRLLAAPAVGERAGVAGVVQHPQHGGMQQRLPVDLALAGSFEVPPGERQPGGAECFHDGGGRPGGLERGEQVPDRALDRGVGVEDDVPGAVVGQADGQRHDQLAAAGLGDDPAAQPGPDEMELSLADLPFHPEHEAVVEAAGVIEAVFVADQGAGQAADLEELMPVGVVAGQPGAFQAEHDPGPAQ